MSLPASQGSRGCSQPPAVAVGAFRGCGVRISLVRPSTSFVSHKKQHFDSAARGGEGGFSPSPGAKAGCQLGSTAGTLPGGAPQHRLLPQCLAGSSAGETEAQAALTAGTVVKSEPGAHSHCKLDTVSWLFFFFLYKLFVLRVPKPPLFCKLRVFRKRREGEVLQAQGCTRLLKLSLTSKPSDCAFPFLPGKPGPKCHWGWPGARKAHHCHEFAQAQTSSASRENHLAHRGRVNVKLRCFVPSPFAPREPL